MTVLRFAGVIIVFAGVALFGVCFIGGHARAARGGAAPASWRGPGCLKGMRIVGLGACLLLSAYLISFFIPDGS
jgi:hypothetical protein